jgi:hypothetical protein
MAARNRRRGQAAVEFALIWSAIIMPLTAIIIFTAQMMWVWHSAVEFTREGARYAVTHCYQGNGENVRTYMRANVPKMVDQDQFRDGGADIDIAYFQRNAETGALEEFTCGGAECSRECVPDIVSVRINNYQFRALFSFFGLPPVSLPNFSTTLPIESAGCSPDSESCLP